ncbi:MAG: PAS domain-containing sensor histidine kinase [Chitinophagales bacterium]
MPEIYGKKDTSINEPIPSACNEFGSNASLISDAMIIMNSQYRIEFTNNHAQRIFNYQTDDLVGKHIKRLVSKKHLKLFVERVASCFSGLVAECEFEILCQRSDGSVFPLLLKVKPLNSGGNSSVSIVFSDADYYKLEEERLLLQQFSVEYAKEAVFWLDKKGNILYSNEKACQATGYNTLELYLTNASLLAPSMQLRDWAELWKEVKQYGKNTFELAIKNKDNKSFPFEITANYTSLNGKEYICLFAENISNRKLKERQIEEYARALERRNRELEEFNYLTSHYLKEPLRRISGFIQILDRRYNNKLDKDAHEFIDYVVDGVNRMNDLLQDLSYYSSFSLRHKPFVVNSLERIFDATIQDLNKEITKSQAVISHRILPDVMGDSFELTHLFTNLIRNAIQYCGDKNPKINIGVEKGDKFWTFSIKDNGIGIEPDYREKVFRIFNQLEQPENVDAGTGIGLAICRRIIEKHRGHIWLGSDTCEGVTVYFTLPIL